MARSKSNGKSCRSARVPRSVMSPRLGGIDRVQVTNPFAMLGILPVGNINHVLRKSPACRSLHCASSARPNPSGSGQIPRASCRWPLHSHAPSRRPGQSPPERCHRPRQPPVTTTGRAGSSHQPHSPPTRARRWSCRPRSSPAPSATASRRGFRPGRSTWRRRSDSRKRPGRIRKVVLQHAKLLHHVELHTTSESSSRSASRPYKAVIRPSRKPSRSTPPFTAVIDVAAPSPSTARTSRRPGYGQSFTRPEASFSFTACQRKLAVDSRKAINTPRSPGCFLSRNPSLLVPTKTLPPCHHRISVRLRAERRDPLHVLLRLHIPTVGSLAILETMLRSGVPPHMGQSSRLDRIGRPARGCRARARPLPS